MIATATPSLRPGASDVVMRRLFPKANPYRQDPNGWARSKGLHLWSKQREINDSIVEHRYTAVQSCHGIGKSFDAAVLANWWLDVHPPGEAFLVTTAPTGRQVYAILWRYIRRMHNAFGLPGRITLDADYYLSIGGTDELVGYGRKPADYDPAAFQGIHAKYVLVIVDEACGVPVALFDAVDSLVTSEGSRVLAIGNPDDPSSHFKKACEEWESRITVSAFDAPCFTGEEVPEHVADELVTRRWVEERKERWGEDSPVYASKVLGEFPKDSEDAVVPGSWAFRCQNTPAESDAKLPNEAGIDCGAGGDRTVMVHRRGLKARVLFEGKTPDTMAAADEVHQLIVKNKIDRVKIDVIGVGQGITDQLTRLSRGRYKVVPVNVGKRSSDPSRFARLRDELWWNARELCETDGWDLSDMPDDFIAELTAPKYKFDASKRINVERKDETKKRLGKSPDLADAALLAFGEPASTAKRWSMI